MGKLRLKVLRIVYHAHNANFEIERQLFWFDLDANFSVETVISASSLHSVGAQGSQWKGQGAFFTDINSTTLYSFAGSDNTDAMSQNSIETFNTTSQAWGNTNVRGGAFNKLARSFSVSANTLTSGLGLNFFLGGAEKYGSESYNPRGLIRFDASDPTEPKWTNETKGAAPLVGATMQYARFGDQGVLVAVGGYKGVSAIGNLPTNFRLTMRLLGRGLELKEHVSHHGLRYSILSMVSLCT